MMADAAAPGGDGKSGLEAVLEMDGLSWRGLIRAILREAAEANVSNRSAQLAFWFLMGFFPMLLCVTSMVSLLSSAPDSQATLMSYIADVLPSGASHLVRQVLAQTASSGRASFSLLFALWSSSSATAGLINTLNGIYRLRESRPWWKYQVTSIALAIALGVLLTAALIIVVYGPFIFHSIAPGSGSLLVWKVAQWPVAALLLILALLGLYRFAPDIRKQKWKWLLPGAVIAAAIWMVASILFKLYVRHFSQFGLLYGSLGTLIILMLWFYLSGVAILVGGEINALLEDAAAKRGVPGAKRRGQRSLAETA